MVAFAPRADYMLTQVRPPWSHLANRKGLLSFLFPTNFAN
jgi:hypothetical protein